MNPNPFVALNHLTVPVAIDLSRDSKVGRAEAPRRAPLSVRRVASARIKRYETTSSADIDEQAWSAKMVNSRLYDFRRVRSGQSHPPRPCATCAPAS